MDYLRLDFNENTQGASPKVIEAIRKMTAVELSCYPEYEDFNRALSQFLGVDAENILPTNGSDEAIRTLFETYVDKGDEVILLTPSYSLYELFAQIAGAKIIWIPYSEDFSFPIEKVMQAIHSKTRLIALANPNNPTGTVICREDLQRIIEVNPEMLVLLDEAYAHFARLTNIDFIDRYPNVFITQTFSKVFGLAGLRIGTLISSKENIQVVAKVLSPTYSVDRVAVVAVMAAIQDRAYYDEYIEEVTCQRQLFIQEMQMLGFASIPSVTNFVLVNFGELAQPIRVFLERNKVLVRERSEKCFENYLRITIGTKEQMQRVLELLRFFSRTPALIFDMDGVLIDEGGSYRQCIQKTVKSFSGKDIDLSSIEIFKRKGGLNNDYDCTRAILSEFGVEICHGAIVQQFNAYYEDLKIFEEWLLDEAILLKIKEKFRLGIFTGRPKKDAFDALKRFDKESFFEVVITDDDVDKRKPNPEGLLLVLQHLGVKKGIYLGDTKDDAEAAERASVNFIGVVPPKGSNKTFKDLYPFLEDIREIERML
jgi:histidinol-phosphate aminotransferase